MHLVLLSARGLARESPPRPWSQPLADLYCQLCIWLPSRAAPLSPHAPPSQPPSASPQGLGLSGVDLYFALARGVQGAPACDMSKLLDTNYHFLAPELAAESGELRRRWGPGCTARWAAGVLQVL